MASVHGVDYFPDEPRLGVHYELLDMREVDRITVKPARAARRARRAVGDARLADRRPPGARDLRHVRRDLRRPPEPAPDPHARGLRGPPAAPRLPGRRRAGAASPTTSRATRGTRNEHAEVEPDVSPTARWRTRTSSRTSRTRRRAGAADAQPRPAPPRHARGAAAADHARGRGRARHQADHRLRPHRHREDRRGQGVLEGHPGHRADGLPLLLLQRDGVLRRRRDAARPRGAAARAVPARASTWSSTGSPRT